MVEIFATDMTTVQVMVLSMLQTLEMVKVLEEVEEMWALPCMEKHQGMEDVIAVVNVAVSLVACAASASYWSYV